MLKYPLQDPPLYGDSDYKQRNGFISNFSPQQYINLLPKLSMDEETIENIDELYNMIINGNLIDPPTLYLDGNNIINHDGRHRAYAAIKAELNYIPVLVLDINNTTPQINNLKKQDKINEIIKEEILFLHGHLEQI